MTEKRILYVCADCADNAYESCGWYDRNMLRVVDDGRWLCDGCFDCRDFNPDDGRCWSDFPAPPEYGPIPSSDRAKDNEQEGQGQ